MVTHSLPLAPTKTGVPILASAARRGRVPSERCVIVRGVLLDDELSRDAPRARPPCRVDGVSGTRTELSEHHIFFMPSSHWSKTHVHSWLPACKIARELLQLVAGSPMTAVR